ncbi:transcriptional regulator CynR [Streptomyces sp. NPDC007100]|uniref:transcriptional regulator CynR n=1 Tax=unclassified Streptomyces TaxID=2593676 RepID=UPI0033EAFB03
MALELRHLRYLLAVAEHASFTRAAEALHVSQPTLSQQVKQLERALKVQLLDRTGRTVRLTDAGRAYAHYARSALRDLDAAERAVLDVRDLTRGTLRLATTPTFTAYLVGPLAAAFHTRYPGISLILRELPQDRMEAALLADELDLGIAFSGPHLPGVTGTALFTETLGLVVGPAHPQAGRTAPLPIRSLRDHRLALLSADFATRLHIDTHFGAHGVQPRIAVEANSITTLTELVRRTTLATVLPDAITREQPGLHPVGLSPALPARTVTLLRRETAYRSAASGAFTGLAREWGREHEEGAGQGHHRGYR